MGVIDLPRAYFSGFTYWNPSTMNNNDQQPNYDPSSATLNWSWLERHGLRGEADFDSVRHQAQRPATRRTTPSTSASIPHAPPAEWNFYGDNTCGFVQPDQPQLEWPSRFTKPAGGTTVTGFTNDATEARRRRRPLDRPSHPAQRRHGRREARGRRSAGPVELADLRRYREPRVAERVRGLHGRDGRPGPLALGVLRPQPERAGRHHDRGRRVGDVAARPPRQGPDDPRARTQSPGRSPRRSTRPCSTPACSA